MVVFNGVWIRKLSYISCAVSKKVGFPYSLPSIGPGADASVQAVSPQVTISHPPRPAGYLPSRKASPSPGWYQVIILLGDRCEPLAQGCYAAFAPGRI